MNDTKYIVHGSTNKNYSKRRSFFSEKIAEVSLNFTSCFRKMDIPPGGGEVDYFTAAMGNIAGLGDISFPPEDNPHIAAATSQLDYLANTDAAFEDRMAFTPTTMPRHIDEAGLLAQLVSLCVLCQTAPFSGASITIRAACIIVDLYLNKITHIYFNSITLFTCLLCMYCLYYNHVH